MTWYCKDQVVCTEATENELDLLYIRERYNSYKECQAQCPVSLSQRILNAASTATASNTSGVETAVNFSIQDYLIWFNKVWDQKNQFAVTKVSGPKPVWRGASNAPSSAVILLSLYTEKFRGKWDYSRYVPELIIAFCEKARSNVEYAILLNSVRSEYDKILVWFAELNDRVNRKLNSESNSLNYLHEYTRVLFAHMETRFHFFKVENVMPVRPTNFMEIIPYLRIEIFRTFKSTMERFGDPLYTFSTFHDPFRTLSPMCPTIPESVFLKAAGAKKILEGIACMGEDPQASTSMGFLIESEKGQWDKEKNYGFLLPNKAFLTFSKRLIDNAKSCTKDVFVFTLKTYGHIAIAILFRSLNTIEIFDSSGATSNDKSYTYAFTIFFGILDKKTCSAITEKNITCRNIANMGTLACNIPSHVKQTKTMLQPRKISYEFVNPESLQISSDQYCQTYIYFYAYQRLIHKKKAKDIVQGLREMFPADRVLLMASFGEYLIKVDEKSRVTRAQWKNLFREFEKKFDIQFVLPYLRWFRFKDRNYLLRFNECEKSTREYFTMDPSYDFLLISNIKVNGTIDPMVFDFYMNCFIEQNLITYGETEYNEIKLFLQWIEVFEKNSEQNLMRKKNPKMQLRSSPPQSIGMTRDELYQLILKNVAPDYLNPLNPKTLQCSNDMEFANWLKNAPNSLKLLQFILSKMK